MLSRIFGNPKRKQINTVSTLDKWTEVLQLQEKKEKILVKKVAYEIEKAKRYDRANNNKEAIQCLKNKKLYEQQIEALGNSKMRIHEHMVLLEDGKTSTTIVEAVRSGVPSLKSMQETMELIDFLNKAMEEIQQQCDNIDELAQQLEELEQWKNSRQRARSLP